MSSPALPEIQINLLAFASSLRTKANHNGENTIWCPIRRKWIQLTPEEMVRQCAIAYLIEKQGYSRGCIGVEKGFKINGRTKRFDVVLFNREGTPALLVECKAFDIPIKQTLFDQLSAYNQRLQAPWLWATNGRQSYICQIDQAGQYRFISDTFPRL